MVDVPQINALAKAPVQVLEGMVTTPEQVETQTAKYVYPDGLIDEVQGDENDLQKNERTHEEVGGNAAMVGGSRSGAGSHADEDI